MMIIRDTKVAWIISGSFELIEISFRHWLPNFWECWWDHVSSFFYNYFYTAWIGFIWMQYVWHYFRFMDNKIFWSFKNKLDL